MFWITPQFTRGQVDAAGLTLIRDVSVEELEEERELALNIINNWRSSHSFPLQVLKMSLIKRAKRVDSKSLVAQRLKRLTSITAKLKRTPDMNFSRMHDIGGCRAVVRRVSAAERLVRVCQKSAAKNPRVRPNLLEHTITSPRQNRMGIAAFTLYTSIGVRLQSTPVTTVSESRSRSVLDFSTHGQLP